MLLVKKLFLLTCLLYASLIVNAQVGFRAGNNISFPPYNQYDVGLGLQMGFVGRFETDSRFSIQPEILWVMQVFYGNTGDPDDYVSTKNYLTVPLMCRLNVFSKLYGEVGPQLSYLVTSDFLYSRSWDFALNVGAGFYIPYLSSDVYARYSHGLNSATSNSLSGKQTINVVQLGMLVWF